MSLEQQSIGHGKMKKIILRVEPDIKTLQF